MDRLAEKLAMKMQKAVTESIYRDAGKNIFAMAKNAFWGLVVAFAAWGAAKYGNGS